MDFLQLRNKTFLVSGVANKKSVAYFVTKILLEHEAQVILTVQNEQCFNQALKLFPQLPIYICDVEKEVDLLKLGQSVENHHGKLSGFLHSLAFAPFGSGPVPFHQTSIPDFLKASHISWLSFITLSNALKSVFHPEASVVTISISNTKATSYGYLGPIKAALENSVAYLAKSFSEFSRVRFNVVCAGPLKTSASAGIPDYLDNYLYAEQLVLRKEALKTDEVANTICFLLSPRSSGINGTGILVDAGMACNYFDQKVVKAVAKDLY